MKSYAIYGIMSFPTGFKVTVLFKGEYLKNGVKPAIVTVEY